MAQRTKAYEREIDLEKLTMGLRSHQLCRAPNAMAGRLRDPWGFGGLSLSFGVM